MTALDGHAFQPTRWTLVARATRGDAPAARAALEELCQLYWPPLCSFARRWGLSPADAEDATQAFFAELLRNDKFAIADPERGKLRTFLLHTFTQRLLSFHRAARAQSRGGGDPTISIDAPLPETGRPPDLADPQTPELEFNRQWAVTTMETALSRLEAEYIQANKLPLFTACRPLLTLAAAGNEDYSAIARQLGMKEGTARVITHRLRLRFREIIFAIVAETLEDPTESTVRAEITLLIDSLV
jgi:RNA polymerase sigma factor (sigma-70 family)